MTAWSQTIWNGGSSIPSMACSHTHGSTSGWTTAASTCKTPAACLPGTRSDTPTPEAHDDQRRAGRHPRHAGSIARTLPDAHEGSRGDIAKPELEDRACDLTLLLTNPELDLLRLNDGTYYTMKDWYQDMAAFIQFYGPPQPLQ